MSVPRTPAPYVSPEVARYLLAIIEPARTAYRADGSGQAEQVRYCDALCDLVSALRYFANPEPEDAP